MLLANENGSKEGSTTVCDKEDYPYEPMTSGDLKESWRFAIGLQEVDGLCPSKYLRSLASDTIEGEMSLDAAGKAIRAHRKLRDESGEATDTGERKADFVSQRITELLIRREQRIAFARHALLRHFSKPHPSSGICPYQRRLGSSVPAYWCVPNAAWLCRKGQRRVVALRF